MRSKSNDLYFKTADQHFPLVFPTIVWVFKVEVTVSKNALKLRLFTIGTPFLTLGLSVEQAAPGERNVSAGKARVARHWPAIRKCIHSPAAAGFRRHVPTINEMLVFRLWPLF